MPALILKQSTFRDVVLFEVNLGTPRDTNFTYLWNRGAPRLSQTFSASQTSCLSSHNLIALSEDPGTTLLCPPPRQLKGRTM